MHLSQKKPQNWLMRIGKILSLLLKFQSNYKKVGAWKKQRWFYLKHSIKQKPRKAGQKKVQISDRISFLAKSIKCWATNIFLSNKWNTCIFSHWYAHKNYQKRQLKTYFQIYFMRYKDTFFLLKTTRKVSFSKFTICQRKTKRSMKY